MGKGYQIDFLNEEFQIKKSLVKINKPVNQNSSNLIFAPYKEYGYKLFESDHN